MSRDVDTPSSFWVSEFSPRVHGRIAGMLYLITIAAGLFAEVSVRDRLIVPGDAAASDGVLSHLRPIS